MTKNPAENADNPKTSKGDAAKSLPAHYSLRIGELATRTGRSIHSIRWYEVQGLMPGVMRDGGRQRLYSEYHIGWLEMIERLRSTGMSIAQLRDYAKLISQGKSALPQRRAVLAAHRVRVEENIAKWSEALQLIDAKIDFYGEWIAQGERPAIAPPQRVREAKQRQSSPAAVTPAPRDA